MQHDSRIRALEERAFNAWPALETVLAGGWVLRFSRGYTKRANSVNALRPELPVADILAMAAPLYAARGLPLVVRVSPLAEDATDRWLAGAGWQAADETRVMVAPLDGAPGMDRDVVLASSPAGWSAGFAEANGVPGIHRETLGLMLAAIRVPAVFATLTDGGRPVAFGLGVLERGMVGLFDIVTLPAARRTGAGRRLVRSLMAWGAERGARDAYLQVVASNAPAVRLYEQLGFADVYRYHYRLAAGAEAPRTA